MSVHFLLNLLNELGKDTMRGLPSNSVCLKRLCNWLYLD